MITELRLKNWKSFSDAKLFIDPITVIIGTNASGKSNIFDALKLLSAVASPIDIADVAKNVRGGADGIIRRDEKECNLSVSMDGDKSTEQLIYELTLAIDDQRYIYIKDETLLLVTSKRKLVMFVRKELDEMNKSLVSVALYTEGKPRIQTFSAKTSVLSQIEYVNCVRRIKDSVLIVVNNLKKIRLSNPIPERMRDFAPLSKTISEDASDLAGYLANLDKKVQLETYDAILKYLRPLPDSDIKSIRADKIPMTDKAMLFCTEEWIVGHPQEQSALGMSDGTLRFLGIISMLITAENKSLILLEELDKGIHPSRANNLVVSHR